MGRYGRDGTLRSKQGVEKDRKINKILLMFGIGGSLTGCIFVALGYPLFANLIWVLLNPCLVVYNFRRREDWQAKLWMAYVIIAVVGVILNWR